MDAVRAVTLLAVFFSLSACAPEPGSTAWCEKMDNTPKGDWTMDDAGIYAQNCIFRKSD